MVHYPTIGSCLVHSSNIHSSGLTPVTVLIVDDDDLVRSLGAELLSDAGFRVLEAGNAEEALSLLESDPDIKIFFSDINMPGPLDGIALASLAALQWPHLEIIIGSGNALPLSASLPDGTTFIRKPWNPESLIRLVRERTTTPA